MSAAVFSCPECDTALRGADKVPAGKEVRCPSCSAVFVMPEYKASTSSQSIREKPQPNAGSRPMHPGHADDESPRSKSRPHDEEESDRPRRKSRAADEDVVNEEYVEDEPLEDDEIEDRPRKKRRKKKKKARQGGSVLLTALIIAAGVAVLAGVGVLVWFLLPGGGEDPLAFIPADFDIFIGADEAALAGDSKLGPAWKKSQQAGGADILNGVQTANSLGPGDVDVSITAFKTSDIKLGAQRGAGPNATVIIVTKFKKPFDKKLSVKNLKNAVPAQLNGKEYYQVSDPLIKTVYMPSTKIVIFTSLTGAQLEPVLKSNGKTVSLPSDTVSAINDLRKNAIWGLAKLSTKTKSDLDAALAKDPPPPELKPLVEGLAKASRFSFWAKLEADKINMNLSAECADANAASQVAGQLQNGLNLAKGQMGMLDMILGFLPKTKQLFDEFTANVKFSSQGATASITVSINKQTLGDALQEVTSFAPGGAGAGGFQPPNRGVGDGGPAGGPPKGGGLPKGGGGAPKGGGRKGGRPGG